MIVRADLQAPNEELFGDSVVPGNVSEHAFPPEPVRSRQGRASVTIPPAPSPTPAASVDVGQSAALVPEYGRSVVSTQQEGVVKMAQQIVGLMEEPW